LLEKLLVENNLDTADIIKNLKTITEIRNTSLPFHKVPTEEALKALKVANITLPFDWNREWSICIDLYANSLENLSDQLASMLLRARNQKPIENKVLEAFEKEGRVVYLNDALYKYRLLVPIYYKYEYEWFVDYLTAAVIAYDRDLKSIDYALRKYVIPSKEKFTEHYESVYFVKKRKYMPNDVLSNHGIILQWDKLLIKKDEEFLRYFRYVYAAIVACQMGITTDWLIKEYWGPSWLSKDYKKV
jgi:hypothetical protein